MEADITMLSSVENSVKSIEVTTSELKMAYNNGVDDSSILITGIEKEFNQQIKMLLMPNFYLNVLQFDNKESCPERNLSFSNISSGDNQCKILKIILYQATPIRDGLGDFPLCLELNVDSNSLSNDDNSLIKHMIQNGFMDITAMLFKCFDKNGQTLQHYAFFNTGLIRPPTDFIKLMKIYLSCQTDIKMKVDDQIILHLVLTCRLILDQSLKEGMLNIVNTMKGINNKLLYPTVSCIEYLLHMLVDINLINETTTLLYLAAEYDDLELLKVILKKNPDLDIQCIDGKTALHEAVVNRNLEMVDMLLKNNANINIEDIKRRTPLFYALERLDNIDNDDANNKRKQIMVNLLSNGANPNVECEDGQSLLNLACQFRDFFAIETLLKYNVDVNFQAEYGQTPLHDVFYLEALENDYEVELELKCAKILIENGANINLADEFDDTALHFASLVHGALPIVEILLENKASVNVRNKDGITPLHNACQTLDLEMVKALLNHNADISIRDNEGFSPLHFAALVDYWRHSVDGSAEFKSIVELLITKIDIDDKDEEGKTPLHIACQHGIPNIDEDSINRQVRHHSSTVHTLIDFGASINAVDNDGITPLYTCLMRGTPKITEVLINYGADINILDKDNKLPLKDIIENITPFNENRLSLKRSLDPFFKHIIKLNYIGMYVCEVNLNVVFGRSDVCDATWIEEYKNSCAEELARMKLEVLPHSRTSFYNILIKKIHDMVHLINIDNLIESLSSIELVKKFPIYGHVLRCRFAEGRERGLLVLNIRALTKVNIFKRLPDLCIHEILRYLTLQELKLLTQVIETVV